LKQSFEVPFNQLFVNIGERPCTTCNKETSTTDRINCDIPFANNFLLLRINNFYYDRITQRPIQLNAKLTNYNIDRIIIPNNRNITYKINSAIMYSGNGDAGHYVCWKRSNNCWLKISDYTVTVYPNLIQNLKNVYLLFLEKNSN